jgi:hypothetical protein
MCSLIISANTTVAAAKSYTGGTKHQLLALNF